VATLIDFAQQDPDRPALVFDNGAARESYAELEQRSRRIAHLLRARGLRPGDGIAALLGNDEEFFDIFWAAMRSGLYFTAVNWHLAPAEVQYIVDNSDSRVLFASARFEKLAAEAAAGAGRLGRAIALHGEIEGFRRFEDELADVPEDAPLDDQREGAIMLYSSGTTGRPKGVRHPLSNKPFGDPEATLRSVGLSALFGFKEGDRYLCPAPLYHAAPLAFTTGQHRIGGTGVVMSRFDAEEALRLIQDQQIDTSQWVPTHFKRLLQLPEQVRTRYDLSTHRVAVHAAAPCPIPVKRAMIEWWGPIVVEYYAGTEGGGTLIRSEEWLEHPGSVGRHWAGGTLHILDEDGNEIEEPDRDGAVYFEAPPDSAQRFRYYKDDEKTSNTYRGSLFTLGDIGHLDADGYLYLTDRQSNMIISGGVNIYPQETENQLLTHPKVDDVAVIGVPNDEMGEEVKAVVIPAAGVEPGPALETELIDYCRLHIAHYKCPRSIDFADDLPRQPTGKLYKRLIRHKYWEGHESGLV
jgi:acyl-CoA synthetase (AMP-forming)/AMP-acid ligase II